MAILNDQFKSMTEAQKTYVLSMLVNKALQNPTVYGLREDGTLQVGQRVHFSKLFEDQNEIESIFKKAKETITTGSPKEKLILDNQAKISEWVKTHAGEVVTNSKIEDILNTKPKTEIPPPKITSEPLYTDPIEPEVAPISVKDSQHEVVEDIESAKKRLAELEGLAQKQEQGLNSQQSQVPIKKEPVLERTMSSDSRMVAERAESNVAVNQGLEQGVNNIYSKRGFIKKTPGIQTEEWQEMAGFLVSDILEYTKGEAERSKLPPQFVRALELPQHQAFVAEMKNLMSQAEVVTPRQGEKTGEFMKRLIEFIMIRRPQLEQSMNLRKAA